MVLRLSDSAVRRVRLEKQLLVGRGRGSAPSGAGSGSGSVEDVVGTVVGVQAQDVAAAALAVRARGRGLAAADVDRARDDRRVVLTWSLRGTRHLHRAEDVRPLVALLGPAFLRPSRRAEQLGIGGTAGERAVRALRDALGEEGPLTRAEVKARLAPHGVDPSGQAAIHVIARAALEGLVAVIPGERYVLLDDWLGPAAADADASWGDPGPELARRYLAAFGPATVADFASWSGLGAPAARGVWSAIAADVVEVESPGGPLWLLAADADRVAAAADNGRRRRRPEVRLLGAFDSILLAYADRRLHLDPRHARQVNSGGGMVRPTVLIDGEVTGTWSHRRGEVVISPFRPLTPSEAAAVEDEIEAVERFQQGSPPSRRER